MNVVWAEVALAHLRSAYEYIAADNPAAADKMTDRIFAAVEHLALHPSLGRPGRVTDTRELVIPGSPYIIAYQVAAGRIEVLAVLHAARQWPERL